MNKYIVICRGINPEYFEVLYANIDMDRAIEEIKQISNTWEHHYSFFNSETLKLELKICYGLLESEYIVNGVRHIILKDMIKD